MLLEGNLFQHCKYAIHIYRENISPPEIAQEVYASVGVDAFVLAEA